MESWRCDHGEGEKALHELPWWGRGGVNVEREKRPFA
jgi:hypothetical protein